MSSGVEAKFSMQLSTAQKKFMKKGAYLINRQSAVVHSQDRATCWIRGSNEALKY